MSFMSFRILFGGLMSFWSTAAERIRNYLTLRISQTEHKA